MPALIHINPGQEDVRSLDEKQQALFTRLRELSSLIVALSGGADSAYLAWAAHHALGDRALGVTALSASFSAYDREMVNAFATHVGLRHELLSTNELENPAYRANAADRCYHCKDELFTVLDDLAQRRGFAAVAYGVNADDIRDFRPGHRAAREHAVVAPLLEVNLHKSEIRELSRRAGLPTWDRPASACLSSRIPYGAEVTPERLALIERGEAALRGLGFRQFRVRLHDTLARVEIEKSELPRALQPKVAAEISQRLKAAGFAYVTLDLQGYRQGSLNEALSQSQRAGS